jgi:hypothetical protein
MGVTAAVAVQDAAAAAADRGALAAANADALPEAAAADSALGAPAVPQSSVAPAAPAPRSSIIAPAAPAPAAPRDSTAAAMQQRGITPDAMPASAPGFAAGAFPTPGMLGVTPFGPTPVPPTAFKQGWRPGATPEATPGGLMGHFTALVTPGGPSWPEGMPAGGLVPYSITPPAGGRTATRTVLGTRRRPERPASRGGLAAENAAAADVIGAAGTGAAATGQQRGLTAAVGGTQEVVGVRPYRSVTPQPAATVFETSGRSGSSSQRSVTPELRGGEPKLGCGEVSEGGSRSQTPGRTPHSAAKNAALAAQLQVRAGLRAGGGLALVLSEPASCGCRLSRVESCGSSTS